MLVNAQKLQSQWGCREIVGMEQPSDDTPSVSPCGLPAPSEREPGTPSSSRVPFIVSPGNHDVAGDFHRPYATQKILDFTIHRAARKPEGGGRFSSPLRNSDDFGFYHSSKDTPSASHSLSSSLREGAGMRSVPFNVPLRNRNVAGDFHRPYESSEVFTFRHSPNPETQFFPKRKEKFL